MTSYDHDKILRHWDNFEVESMYDKNLLNAEIDLIRKYIPKGSKILDAGCGEGEGTEVYCSVPKVTIHAVDFSSTRLNKAKHRLLKAKNVTLKKIDFMGNYNLEKNYDLVISQRFLINITKWELQKKLLLDLMHHLKKGGHLVLLEGSIQGVEELNQFRNSLNLASIPVPWHNLFFDEDRLISFMQKNKYELIADDGLGAYFFLTRGVRPALDTELNWDCSFNKIAISEEVGRTLGFKSRFSRLKLWVFQK